MNWIILIFLVPVIIIPVVLLWGFAGCEPFESAEAEKSPEPTNLKATAKGTHLITLEWQDNSGGTAKFKVTRVEEGSPPPPSKTYDNLAGRTFNDTEGLKEGTTYFYTVQAGKSGGLDSDPSNQSAATTFPTPPANVVATPQEVNKIELSWTNTSNKADQFIIQDKSIPAGGVTKTEVRNGDPCPFPLSVLEGSEHEFQVLAFVAGFQENLPEKEVKSLPSPPVTAKPLAFKATLTTDQPNRQGRCLVQRIPKVLLKNKGTQVKITVRGSSTQSLTIDRIYISQPATSGNLWDSLPPGLPGGLTKVIDKDLGDPSVFLPAGARKTLGPIPYNLDQANDLLIAFDISPDPGQGNIISVALLGATAHLRASTQQAAVDNRAPGYNSEPNTLYVVEKIEVR